MSNGEPIKADRLTVLSLTLVPFGLMLSAGFFFALAQPSVPHARAQYTIWLSLFLLMPAISIFVLRAGRMQLGSLWRLFWTFSFLAYLIHFYYGHFVMFGGDLRAVFSAQGVGVAFANYLLTILWGVSTIVAWVRPVSTLARNYLHWPTTLFALASAIGSTLFSGRQLDIATDPASAIAFLLGGLAVGVGLLSFLARWLGQAPEQSPASRG